MLKPYFFKYIVNRYYDIFLFDTNMKMKVHMKLEIWSEVLI